MARIKDSLPTKAALEARLQSVMEEELEQFLTATHDRRRQVKASFWFGSTAVLFLLALSVFLFLTRLATDGWAFKLLLVLALLWATALLLFGRMWFLNTRLLAREMNMALVPVFTQLFDRLFLYTHNSAEEESVKQALRDSALLTSDTLTIQADDAYTAFTDNRQEIHFHELSVTTKVAHTQSGHQAPVEVFRGLVMWTDLSFTHNAETYISTDGDRAGFAHKTFWSMLLGRHTVQETILEWGEFEDALHVATSDPVVARQLLTPDLMQEIYDWWSEHRLNMRIAVKANQLYLLIPEASIRIGSSTTSTRLPVIKRYAESLARPIWRGLRLIEDVST